MSVLIADFVEKLGLPIPGRAQGQDGWSPEQPGLVGGAPARGRGVKADDL